MSGFQLVGLEHTQFDALFEKSEGELRSQGIVRRVATAQPGYPCRISLEDAAIGEEVLLLPHWHHRVDSPYRALGPIYIRRDVTQAVLSPGVVPAYVASRLMSLRAYDRDHMMVAADVCAGTGVSDHLIDMFGDPVVSYIHLHNAKQGCFSCAAARASEATAC